MIEIKKFQFDNKNLMKIAQNIRYDVFVIGQNCPEISVKQKKISLKTSIKNFLQPLNFLLNKTLQWALIRVFFKNRKLILDMLKHNTNLYF